VSARAHIEGQVAIVTIRARSRCFTKQQEAAPLRFSGKQIKGGFQMAMGPKGQEYAIKTWNGPMGEPRTLIVHPSGVIMYDPGNDVGVYVVRACRH
jgi:hypothetical protein